jgi:hypothetical protein
MENKNWLQKQAGAIENNIKSLDNAFSKTPPYKSGKKAGGLISDLIDFIVDGSIPQK